MFFVVHFWNFTRFDTIGHCKTKMRTIVDIIQRWLFDYQVGRSGMHIIGRVIDVNLHGFNFRGSKSLSHVFFTSKGRPCFWFHTVFPLPYFCRLSALVCLNRYEDIVLAHLVRLTASRGSNASNTRGWLTKRIQNWELPWLNTADCFGQNVHPLLSSMQRLKSRTDFLTSVGPWGSINLTTSCSFKWFNGSRKISQL